MGISVSRVGGNAQIKSMKKVAGTLKIDQAQFRELESFTKFGGDIDPVTARVIDKGRKNERLLIQPQYQPMEVADEVAVIFCGTRGLLENVPLDKVAESSSSSMPSTPTSSTKSAKATFQTMSLPSSPMQLLKFQPVINKNVFSIPRALRCPGVN